MQQRRSEPIRVHNNFITHLWSLFQLLGPSMVKAGWWQDKNEINPLFPRIQIMEAFQTLLALIPFRIEGK